MTYPIRYPAKPTVEAFRERFGEFGNAVAYPDETVQAMLDTAYQLAAASTECTLYLTAHLLTLEAERTEPLDAGSGEIASESVGGRSANYLTMAKSQGSDVFYSRTFYGRSYLVLRARTPARAMAARVF